MNDVYVGITYRMLGVLFWSNAKTLSDNVELKEDGTPAKYTGIPIYFLISHAVELFLKSALLKRGFLEVDLKKYKYRHNLESLLEELQKMGLIITPKTTELILGLSKQHSEHSLRYDVLLDNGKKTYLPPLPLLFEMLEELLMLTRISTQGI